MKIINKLSFVIIILLVCSVVAVVALNITRQNLGVLIGNKFYPIMLAADYQSQVQGLSDRANLGGYEGMYFIFPTEGRYTMVMRRMQFPLDMVWLDNGKVVDLKSDLPLEPGRTESQLTQYSNNNQLANAVLELKAGEIRRLGIKAGDIIKYCTSASSCEDRP